MSPKHASASKHRRDGVVWYKIKSCEYEKYDCYPEGNSNQGSWKNMKNVILFSNTASCVKMMWPTRKVLSTTAMKHLSSFILMVFFGFLLNKMHSFSSFWDCFYSFFLNIKNSIDSISGTLYLNFISFFLFGKQRCMWNKSFSEYFQFR